MLHGKIASALSAGCLSAHNATVTFSIALLLILTFVAMVLFAVEIISADVVALGLLLSLTLTGLLPPERAFAGFGSDTVIVILGLLILTTALMRTGVMDLAGRTILRYTGNAPGRLLAVIVVSSATLGAFMSNTASTAFFLPVVIGLARRARISPGKLLLPLAFASIVSSSVTLISTSTNIVVSGILKDYKLAPMGMFEMAPVGIPIAVVGVLYLLTVGRRLVRDRFASDAAQDGTLGFRPYLSEIIILPDSPLAGKTVEVAGIGRDLDIRILRILRGKDESLWPDAHVVLKAGDVLVVEGGSEEILRIKDITGIEIKADVKLSDPGLSPEDLGLVEALILPRSELIGRTLKGYGFRERYGIQVLGISRHGETMQRKISTVKLRVGDILLLQGHRDRLQAMEQSDVVRVVGTPEEGRPKLWLAPVAISIFASVIVLPAFNLVSLPIAVMLGVFAVFATRCISSSEAYREVEWKAVILIASMLSLGAAMEHTGTAGYLAGKIAEWTNGCGPSVVLSAFFFLTVLLTQPMSNQAAAIVVLPVAIATAYRLGLNPRSFAMMIAVAASCSYLTPLEPSCLMVYGPGRYRFRDFARVGAPLTLLIYLIAIAIVPRFWPVR